MQNLGVDIFYSLRDANLIVYLLRTTTFCSRQICRILVNLTYRIVRSAKTVLLAVITCCGIRAYIMLLPCALDFKYRQVHRVILYDISIRITNDVFVYTRRLKRLTSPVIRRVIYADIDRVALLGNGVQNKNTIALEINLNGVIVVSARLDGLFSPYKGLTFHQDLRFLMSLRGYDMYLINQRIITCRLRCKLRLERIHDNGITHIGITTVLLTADGLLLTCTNIVSFNFLSYRINRQVQLMVL